LSYFLIEALSKTYSFAVIGWIGLSRAPPQSLWRGFLGYRLKTKITKKTKKTYPGKALIPLGTHSGTPFTVRNCNF